MYSCNKVWRVVPRTSLGSLRRSRVEERGGRGRGAEGEKPLKASKVRTKALKPPSKPSKTQSVEGSEGTFQTFETPFLKANVLSKRKEKSHTRTFETKKREKKMKPNKLSSLKANILSKRKKGESHTRTLLGVKNEEKEIRRK